MKPVSGENIHMVAVWRTESKLSEHLRRDRRRVHLSSACVLAMYRSPRLVEFAFGTVNLWLRNGSERASGAGTDLLIRWDPSRLDLSAWAVMWRSGIPPR